MTHIMINGMRREYTAEEAAESAAISKAAQDLKVIEDQVIARTTRNNKLADCDWTQMSDSPLTSAKKTAWATYRESLRNLPTADAKWPDMAEITWPTQPS